MTRPIESKKVFIYPYRNKIQKKYEKIYEFFMSEDKRITGTQDLIIIT